MGAGFWDLDQLAVLSESGNGNFLLTLVGGVVLVDCPAPALAEFDFVETSAALRIFSVSKVLSESQVRVFKKAWGKEAYPQTFASRCCKLMLWWKPEGVSYLTGGRMPFLYAAETAAGPLTTLSFW